MDDASLVSCLSDNLVAKEPAGDLCYYPIATFPLSKDINGTWRVEIASGRVPMDADAYAYAFYVVEISWWWVQGLCEISEQSCTMTGWRKGGRLLRYHALGRETKKKRRVALILGSACAVTGFLMLQLLGERLALFCIWVD